MILYAFLTKRFLIEIRTMGIEKKNKKTKLMVSETEVLMFVFVGRYTIYNHRHHHHHYFFLTTTYDDDKILSAVAPGAAFTVRIQSGVLQI